MEYIIRLLKIGLIAALLYAAYFFLIKETPQDKPLVYSIESDGPERVIESPESVIGKTFTSNEGLSIYFEDSEVCRVSGTYEEEDFKIKGTSKYKYKKKNKTGAVLKVTFTTSREKGKEILETEYTYEYEMKYSKPTGGKTNCNYVIIHKIGVGDKVKSYVEADNHPTWFELN